MNHFSIIEIAKLTAQVTGGGFKRTATKDIALDKFREAVATRNLDTPTVVPDGWAKDLTFTQASDKLGTLLNGAPAKKEKPKAEPKTVPAEPKGKGKKAAPKSDAPKVKKARVNGGGRPGVRNKKLFPARKDNPFKRGWSFDTWEKIAKAPGKTFRQYVEEGGRTNAIAWAVRCGWLETKD